MLMQTKGFANDTPNVVTFHGLANIFFGNNKSKPGMAQIIRTGKYEDRLVWYFQLYVIEDLLKVPAGQQTQPAVESEFGHSNNQTVLPVIKQTGAYGL